MVSKKPKVAIVGFGVVGQSYAKLFPDAVIYDEPKKLLKIRSDREEIWDTLEARSQANKCDIALVCVFTPHNHDGSLDTSIVEASCRLDRHASYSS
jgi:UDP-glucose 6-dehydrogenase